MKKLYIETLGCQMNKSDTERIKGMLSHFDYHPTENEKEADLFIVNTCAIRQLSTDKAYSKLGYWNKIKKNHKDRDIKIAICGCVAQLEKEQLLKKFSYVDLVFGTRNIFQLPQLLKEIEEKRICATSNQEIVENDYDLSINKYKEIVVEKKEYEKPEVILKRVRQFLFILCSALHKRKRTLQNN